jgi:hypothetical protein
MAAIGDIGFSIIPKFESIYTSAAPSILAVQQNLTLHRSHKSRIEIPTFLSHFRRSNRVYGGDDSNFSEIREAGRYEHNKLRCRGGRVYRVQNLALFTGTVEGVGTSSNVPTFAKATWTDLEL